MTVKIRNNLHHFTKIDHNDAERKIRQNILMLKRNAQIKDLYYQDRERYEYIIKKLGVSYTPPELGKRFLNPTRKGELRRLTNEYCENIKQKRMDEYHEELKAKQEELKEEMKKVEEMIKQEEKFLGIANNQK